jgi:hypothetical protein
MLVIDKPGLDFAFGAFKVCQASSFSLKRHSTACQSILLLESEDEEIGFEQIKYKITESLFKEVLFDLDPQVPRSESSILTFHSLIRHSHCRGHFLCSWKDHQARC